MLEHFFSKDYLKVHYLNNIKNKVNIGTDRIDRETFENKIFDHITVINRKVLDGTYKFTRYRGVMFPKRPDTHPRTVSISTIRDKLALSVLKEVLAKQTMYTKQGLVQTIISDVKNAIDTGKYNAIIKIDIKDFFPSIDHEILIKKLRGNNIDDRITNLVHRAITCEILFDGFKDMSYKNSGKGIPQGLPISNILAEIYLFEFDRKHKNNLNYKYFRYVDDILVLCDISDTRGLLGDLEIDLKKRCLLNVHEIGGGKTTKGLLSDGFDFLGYKYSGSVFSVRDSTVHKLEKSIERIFLEHRKREFSNLKHFIWELNLRVTGAIVENKKKSDRGLPIKKKYGWVFFFSQIDDKKLLFKMDAFIDKMIKRFELTNKIKRESDIKRFIKTHHEVLFNRYNTTYIPNFSNYDLDQKRSVLEEIFEKDTKKMSDNDIEYWFNNLIFKSIKSLEEDVQDFS